MENNLREESYQNFPEENFDSSQTMVEEEMPVRQYAEEPSAASNPVFRKVIRWLVYAAAFLTPLWFLPFTADVLAFSKQTLLIALAGAGLVLYLVDVIKSGVVRFRPSRFYLPVFGLVAAAAVSVIFSVNRWYSVFGVADSRSWSLISLASLAVLFFLAVNVIEDRGKALRNAIAASLALVFLYAVLQVFGIYVFKGSFASRAFNSVGSLNGIGILAALSLAFLTKEARKDHRNTEGLGNTEEVESGHGAGWQEGAVNGLRYLGLALALFLVVLINWWPVWTVAFVSLLSSVAFASAGDASLLKRGRMRLFALPMAVIVLGIFLMLINFNWTSIKSKLPIEVAPSQKVSWHIAWDSLKSRPLGYGAENFAVAYDKLKPASIVNSVFYQLRFADATSEAANSVVEGGVLMALAFLLLFWVFGKELVGKIRNGFDGGETSAIWATGSGLSVALFLYSFNLTLLTFLFMLLALTALSGRDAEAERVLNLENDARYSFAGSIAFIVGLVLVLVVGYFTVNNYLANTYLAKAGKEPDRNKAIEYYVESANANDKDARTYRLLSQTVLAQLAEDLNKGPKKDESRDAYNARVQNEIASAVNISLRATTVDPSNSLNWMNRGVIYQNLLTLVGGADQAAITTFQESLTRNPADPVAYLRIGNVYLATAENQQRAGAARSQIEENLVKAEESFKQAISLYNNYGQALYNLAVVYDRQNKVPDAIKQFEKLVAGNPRDPSIAFQIGLLYYRNNQKENAFRAWQQAVFLFPNYSNARWYLSLVYEERGDLDSALEQVKEIEKFNPDNKLVQERLAQLEAGRRIIPPGKVLDQSPLNQ